MAPNVQVEELLLRWERLQAQGQTLSAEELCRDYPEYQEELARRIRALQAMGELLATMDTPRGEPPTDAGPPGWPRVPGYEILEELGRGGMGVVYKARQQRPHRIVALKMILAGAHAGPQALARFWSESEKTARLRHPHIVQLFEVNEHEGRPYFSLEYLEGGSLAQKLNGTPQPARQAAELVEMLSRAMQAAHQAGIIHRDLKPANILLTADGTPKITDFGLAKRLDAETQQTPSGAVLGTPSYMAPEQAAGKSKAIGPAADVYALGAILYEMLTGRPPFKGETLWDTVQQVIAVEPVPPRRLQPKVPRDLETICLKCVQKEPRKRYTSAAALGDDLRRFLEGRPILARQVSGGERFWRWCRRNPAVASLTTAVAISLFAGTAISAYFAVQATQRAEDLRRQLYASNVNRAASEWQNNNVSVAEQLLAACPEDLRGWEWRYARALCYKDQVTIYGCFAPGISWYGNIAHQTVAFSPDSQWVATMDWDHILKLWDTATGSRVRAMQGDTGVVFSLAFSPDGKWLASGNADHTVRSWNVETGELVHTLRGHRFLVYHVHFARDGKRIISAGPLLVHHQEWLSQLEIITWDAGTGQQLSRKVVAEANPIWGGIAFSPDGRQFVAAGNAEYRDLGPRIVGYLGSALGQGPFLASAALQPGRPGQDNTLKFGDTATGQCIHTSYSDWTWASAFGPDGRVVATSGWEKIWLWDAATGKRIQSLQGHTDSVSQLAFSPDGTRLASGGMDHTVRLWDTVSGQEVACFRGHRSFIQSVAISPNGQWVASASDDGTLKLWDALRGVEAMTLRGGVDGMWPADVIFSPDGRMLYTFCGQSSSGTPDGIKVWDCADGEQKRTFLGSAGRLTGLAMSPDGKRLASGDKEGNLAFWDAASGHRVDRWAARPGPIHSLAFSHDGKTLAYSSGNQVTVMDPETRREIRTLLASASGLYSLTFSPDNARLAAAAQDRVFVWDWASGQVLYSFAAHTYDERVYNFGPILAFSPDGRLAAADKNRITIRDGRTGGEILALPGPGDFARVESLVFSPDGRRLATGSTSNRAVKVWDTTTGQVTLSLRIREGPLSLAFSPDGERLATSQMDGSLKIWEATPVSIDRMDRRLAHLWVHAHFSHLSGVEDKAALGEPEGLPEAARRFALQMARYRAEQIGRIPAYYQRLGNELWLRGWTGFASRSFTIAENGFRKNVAVNPDKANAHGDFALFLATCPDLQFRDAAKALTHAQQAVALEPANADFAALLGMAQYRAGQWQAAVETLEKAIERRPAQYLDHAQIFLSMAHHQLGHATEAHRWYQQALSARKQDAAEEVAPLRAEAAAVLRIAGHSPATRVTQTNP